MGRTPNGGPRVVSRLSGFGNNRAVPPYLWDFPTQSNGAAYRIRTCDPIITNGNHRTDKDHIFYGLKSYFCAAEPSIPSPAQTGLKSILGVSLLKVLWLSGNLKSHPAFARMRVYCLADHGSNFANRFAL